jgi:hypothetical protein
MQTLETSAIPSADTTSCNYRVLLRQAQWRRVWRKINRPHSLANSAHHVSFPLAGFRESLTCEETIIHLNILPSKAAITYSILKISSYSVSRRLTDVSGWNGTLIAVVQHWLFMHVSILLFLLLWLYSPLLGLGPFFSFLILYTAGRTPWTGDQSVARSLPTHRTTQTQNKHTIQTSMPWVGFEPMIPAFERAKTVHALDRAATVIGCLCM